jgi:cytosine/adenosine deaminase-related metal-dependent hydrolase
MLLLCQKERTVLKQALGRGAVREPARIRLTVRPARAEHARRARAAGRLGADPHAGHLAGTSRAAELPGLVGRIGAIKPGYFADLLVVRGDPVSSITATRVVALVIKSGRSASGARVLPDMPVTSARSR